ncbi:MAG TPA: RNA polymerase sigma factor SigZ, partial [Bacteroidota bacterium]|nr:RNA polymerase sigma factor SigZ [Bacteroidota bacterium]
DEFIIRPLTDTRITALWNELNEPLRSFIRSRISDQDAADDLLQDVFLRIHTRIDTLKDDEKVRSWIYQIARNTIIDHYRRAHPLEEYSDDILGVDHHEHSPDMTAELALSLREMIDELPEPYRRAVILSELEGVGQKELAEREGISLSGAKSRVQRGRRLLKDLLLNCCHFDFDRRGAIMDYHEHCCCCAETHDKH